MHAKRKLIVLFAILVAAQLLAQKNVVPVSSSAYTGIQLPAGTRQDKRILSVSAAALLLEEEAKAFGVKINTAEVFELPAATGAPWDFNQFKTAAQQAGWQVIPAQNSRYGWLHKAGRFYFYYFAANNARTDLYVGEPDGTPALPGTVTETGTQQQTQLPVAQTAARPDVAGVWYKVSASSGNVSYGYSKQQYHFLEDGSYVFYAKTFDVYTPQMVFRKEQGTYTVTGNVLTVTPATSVIQTWSKKDNADKWGTMLKNQAAEKETTSYTIRFHTFIDKVNLLLSPTDGRQTKREGLFGINSDFPNTYFYETPPDESYLIELPPGEKEWLANRKQPEKPRQPEPASTRAATGYTFSVTNWDDGWVSTIEADKVVVTRGSLRVYLYFALPYDDASRNAGRDYYWDTYLTKQFRIVSKRYRDHGEVLSALQAPYIEGTAIDPQTGKNCFLALYVSSYEGMMFPVLAIAPDEQTIRNTFPKAEDKDNSDLAAMSRYNRFSVALSDLVGRWKGGESAAMNYYNAYTGSYAGMSAVVMSDEFEFFANGDYRSKHRGASGMVGSMSTYSLEYKGKATVSRWEIVLPNRDNGKTSKFHAWFEAVQGGRILHLQDMQYSGIRYSLVKE